MKKFIKLLCVALSGVITLSALSLFGGCKLNVPDYSDSTTNINLYAFYGPTDGRKSGGRPMGDGTDQRTIARYQEYKDAGFNILLIENEAAYRGQEWSTCDTKMVMDKCFEVGLDVIVHDVRMYNMAKSKNSLIGQTFNGIKIKTQEDLNEVIAEYMKDYQKHPAFYGVYIMDEPVAAEMPNCLMIVKAIKTVNPDAFIHLCLQNHTTEDFMPEYSEQGWTDLVWDNYHALYKREDPSVGGAKYSPETDTKTVGDKYIRTREYSAKLATEKGIKWSAVSLQNFGGSEGSHNGAENRGWRTIDEVDMRYGVYVTLAFVPDNMVWFHYWSSRYSTVSEYPVSSWMDDYGNKVWYDEGKALNEQILKYGKVLSNMDFMGAHYYTDAHRLPYYYLVENDYTVKGADVKDVQGEMILSELYDANKDLTGYFIVNSKAPFEGESLTATVEFEKKSHAVVYKNGDPEVVKLKGGKLNVQLDCADGILVIPF
jgi:hypothetical protein